MDVVETRAKRHRSGLLTQGLAIASVLLLALGAVEIGFGNAQARRH